jgi:hypothetical protein
MIKNMIRKNVKMNGILLEAEALSRCANCMLAKIDDEESFESIFDDLQQFEELTWKLTRNWTSGCCNSQP